MTRTRGPIGQDASAASRQGGTLSSRLEPTDTILVVEDERDIATFLRAYFRASGQEVVHIDPTSPEEVAAAVTAHDAACVLLDLNLRGFKGLAAYREIRKDEANAFVPVIVITADHSPASRQAALASGVDAFVTKPFNVQEVCDLVVSHVGRAALMADVSRPDAATGVGSHAYLQERLADEVAMSRRGRQPVSLALVRVCSLRQVNLAAGHGVGDLAMREVAGRLTAALPPGTVLARNDGDEFGVILPGTDASAAVEMLEQVLTDAAKPLVLPDASDASVVLRAGLASFPTHGADRDELYMAADAALAGACDERQVVAVAI